jgi:hypothetical protein
VRGPALKAWLVVLAVWTGALFVVFVLKSANGGAGLAWGLIGGGVIVGLFWLFVFVLLRAKARR